MAFTNTTRLAIRHPDLAQSADFSVILANLANDVDGKAVGFYPPGLLSGRPAAGVGAMLYYATDNGILYYDNGTTWTATNLIPSASIGSAQLGPLTINPQSSSYSLVLADAWKIVEMGNAGAINLTIPTNASQAFPVGTGITIVQTGAGQVTLAPAGGVTLRANPGAKIAGQWGMAAIYKRATDEWVASGNLTP